MQYDNTNNNNTDNNNNDPIFTCHKVRSLKENRSTNRGHLKNYSLGLKKHTANFHYMKKVSTLVVDVLVYFCVNGS